MPEKLDIEYSGNGYEDWNSTWNKIGQDDSFNRYDRTHRSFISGGDSAITMVANVIEGLERENRQLKMALKVSIEALKLANACLKWEL